MPDASPIDWASVLQTRLATGPAALVTVLATEGSAPRGAGTRMIVLPTATSGTIGGGQLELRATEQARAMLNLPPGTWRVQDYPLGPLLGQCCGGRVRLLIEHVDAASAGWLAAATPGAIIAHAFTTDGILRRPVEHVTPTIPTARGMRPEPGVEIVERLDPPGRPLFLFGAGHVGRAIVARVPGLPLELHWFDTRPEAAEQPGVALIAEAEIEACIADAPAGAAILILTHDHGLDYRLSAAALRHDFAFVGLIGSATKRARFLSRLAKDGVGEPERARLTCPIGLPAIAGNAPEVIAIATLAQLLALPGEHA